MPKRAFSIEDGNLDVASVAVARKKTYKDLDLTFTRRPNNDIYKKTDSAAVKQSVKNILMTNYAEKPFLPNYGGNLNAFLFNLDTEFDDDLIEEQITAAITNYEPRARIIETNVTTHPEYHEVKASVTFQVITTSEIVTLDLNLTRLR